MHLNFSRFFFFFFFPYFKKTLFKREKKKKEENFVTVNNTVFEKKQCGISKINTKGHEYKSWPKLFLREKKHNANKKKKKKNSNIRCTAIFHGFWMLRANNKSQIINQHLVYDIQPFRFSDFLFSWSSFSWSI